MHSTIKNVKGSPYNNLFSCYIITSRELYKEIVKYIAERVGSKEIFDINLPPTACTYRDSIMLLKEKFAQSPSHNLVVRVDGIESVVKLQQGSSAEEQSRAIHDFDQDIWEHHPFTRDWGLSKKIVLLVYINPNNVNAFESAASSDFASAVWRF